MFFWGFFFISLILQNLNACEQNISIDFFTLNFIAMGLIYDKFFEFVIFISSRFYQRRAVYLMHYAIYTVDNILLMEGRFL